MISGTTRELIFRMITGDSIAQIGNVDLSLIQDEAGSFLLADDSAIGQSFENDQAPLQSPGNLSQIGEEEEDEEEEEGGRKPIEEEVSVGLSTMFLNKRNGPYDLSMIGDQSKFAGALAGGKNFRSIDFTSELSISKSLHWIHLDSSSLQFFFFLDFDPSPRTRISCQISFNLSSSSSFRDQKNLSKASRLQLPRRRPLFTLKLETSHTSQ